MRVNPVYTMPLTGQPVPAPFTRSHYYTNETPALNTIPQNWRERQSISIQRRIRAAKWGERPRSPPSCVFGRHFRQSWTLKTGTRGWEPQWRCIAIGNPRSPSEAAPIATGLLPCPLAGDYARDLVAESGMLVEDCIVSIWRKQEWVHTTGLPEEHFCLRRG